MLFNYLISAYRNLLRSRFFAIINILGLTIGIVSAILVILFVTDELAFDKHHAKYPRIYRVLSDFHVNAKQDIFALSSNSLAPTLKEEYSEIEDFVRFIDVDNFFFRYGGSDFNEENFFFADSSTFKIFDHKFIAGIPETALNRPYSMVLTETFAKQLFGDKNPIGEVLQGLRNEPFEITAVIEDVPRTSHFQFKALVSTATIAEQIGIERFNDNSSGSFWNVNVYTYLLFKEGASPESILSNFEFFNEKYIVPVGNVINGEFAPIFQPLKDTHFTKIEGIQSDFPVGNRSNIYIFSFVALFILIVACINYMNMATARSANRAREVGIRKVVGAGKSKIVFQYLSESILISLIAGFIAIIAAMALIPSFNYLADKEIQVVELLNPIFLVGTFILTLLVGLIAGSYPAFYLSSFSPVRVLKGVVDASKGKLGLRKVLVVFQFMVSIVMIIATVVVSQQQGYIRNKDLGFDKENLMVISDLDTAVSNHFNSFQEELLKHHAIIDVAGSQQVLGVNNSKIVSRIEQEGEMQEIGINLIACDFQYLQTLGIRLADGRFFDPTLRTDSTQAFIINKAAEKAFGWTGEPLGKRVQFGIRMDGSASRDGVVVGVVDDFHYTSIHNPIEPFMFFVSGGAPQVLSIRFKPGESAEAVNFVKQKFSEYNTSRDFSYFFLDQRLDQLYRAEQKLGWLFRVFSLITIFISCLGLLGLSSFVTEQRTKEIGIRKVLGGTSRDIIILLTQQFLVLVLVANVFAWPLAYFAMQKWLEGFAFRIEFAQSPFHIQTLIPLVISGLIALLIAFITVGFLSWRAANSNPANSLKYE